MRPTAYIFNLLQYLVVPYINPANHAPAVEIGHDPGVISSHRLKRKKKNNVNFSVTMRPTAYRCVQPKLWSGSRADALL